MEIHIVIGLIISIFGVSLIFLKDLWRTAVGELGNTGAEFHNMTLEVVGADKFVKYTGVDKRYRTPDKGMIIIGILFVVFGLVVILMPQILSIIAR